MEKYRFKPFMTEKEKSMLNTFLPEKEKRELLTDIQKANSRFGTDCCHGCQRKYLADERNWFGKNDRGQTMVVARCCLHKLVTVDGLGMYVLRDPHPTVQ